MDSTRNRCLVASVFIHGSLLSLLLFAPAFTPHHDSFPVLELVPTNIKATDGDKIGGGSPNAQPPPTVPPKPAPLAEDQPTKPELKPEPKVPRPIVVANDPVRLKPHNISPDNDPLLHPKPPKKPIKPSTDIKVAATLRKRNPQDDPAERKAAEDAAEREAAEKKRQNRADQVARLNQQRQQFAHSLGGAAGAISKNLSGRTTIEMPGPGGQAYAPYGSILGAFYKERWRKPSALSAQMASAVVEVVIARDGSLVDWHVEKSGFRELDDSIAEVIRRHPKLPPLPEGTTDARRTFRIKFTLEADSNT